MTEKGEVMLVDPDEAVIRYVEGSEFEDGQRRVVVTWEHEVADLGICVTPHYLARFLTAMAHAMGMPEGDTEYMAERLAAEIDAAEGV